MMNQPESNPLPPFATLSNKLAEIFQLTSHRLKLISDSISSSIDAQARTIQLDAAQFSNCPKHVPSLSNHSIATVSENENPAASPLRHQATAPAIIPQKRPNSHLSIEPDPHQPLCPRTYNASYTPGLDGTPVDLNLQIHSSPRTPSSPLHTLDGISDRGGSQKVDKIEQIHLTSAALPEASLPDRDGESHQPILDQDGAIHSASRTSSNPNSTDNHDAARSTTKRLIERIAAPPHTIRTGIDTDLTPVSPITPNASSSSRATSMELSYSSDRILTPRNDGRSPSPLSSSRLRSSSCSLSLCDNARATSTSVRKPKHHSSRPPSPNNSYDSGRSYGLKLSTPRESSRGRYESYNLEPTFATFRRSLRYSTYDPTAISTTYHSHSRSPSTSYSQRRGSMPTVNQALVSIEDQRRPDEDPAKRYDDRRGRSNYEKERVDDRGECDVDLKGRHDERRGRHNDWRNRDVGRRDCDDDRRRRDDDRTESDEDRREYEGSQRSCDEDGRKYGREGEQKERDKSRKERDLELYLDGTEEHPSYLRLIEILRSLQSPNNYRLIVSSLELLKEFYWFTQRAGTREERVLGYLYDDPRLMHRYLTVAMKRKIITYRANIACLKESTIKLHLQYRTSASANSRR